MTNGPNGFFARDVAYLREVQYRDSSKLAARTSLHTRYGTAATPWFSWVVEQITWSRDGAVLEVGCGPGWLWEQARHALSADLELVLTDVSEGMVGEAVKRARASFGAVDGAVVNAQSLPFADDSFDVVLANHMLYHVPDPVQAIGELARVLRDDGVLVASTNGPTHLRELDAISREVFGSQRVPRSMDAFGAHTGQPALATYFSSVEWRGYDDGLMCTNVDDVLAYLVSFPPGERATDVELERLHDVLKDRFSEGDGVLSVTKESGAFVCRSA